MSDDRLRTIIDNYGVESFWWMLEAKRNFSLPDYDNNNAVMIDHVDSDTQYDETGEIWHVFDVDGERWRIAGRYVSHYGTELDYYDLDRVEGREKVITEYVVI